jgi:hypothetical protein
MHVIHVIAKVYEQQSRRLKEVMEQLSLKGSSFVEEEEDPLCFTLHSDILSITLKAASLDEVVKWSNSILREQLLFDGNSSAAPYSLTSFIRSYNNN